MLPFLTVVVTVVKAVLVLLFLKKYVYPVYTTAIVITQIRTFFTRGENFIAATEIKKYVMDTIEYV